MIVSRAPTRCGKEHISLRVRHHQQLARSARARAHANVYVRRPARIEPSRGQTGCGRSGAAQPPTVRAPGALEADRSEAQSRSRPSVNTRAAARGRALLQRPDHQARRHLAGVGRAVARRPPGPPAAATPWAPWCSKARRENVLGSTVGPLSRAGGPTRVQRVPW